MHKWTVNNVAFQLFERNVIACCDIPTSTLNWIKQRIERCMIHFYKQYTQGCIHILAFILVFYIQNILKNKLVQDGPGNHSILPVFYTAEMRPAGNLSLQ